MGRPKTDLLWAAKHTNRKVRKAMKRAGGHILYALFVQLHVAHRAYRLGLFNEGYPSSTRYARIMRVLNEFNKFDVEAYSLAGLEERTLTKKQIAFKGAWYAAFHATREIMESPTLRRTYDWLWCPYTTEDSAN